MLASGAQAMRIACNDTSVIVINFQKSKTHAIIITDTYCIIIIINKTTNNNIKNNNINNNNNSHENFTRRGLLWCMWSTSGFEQKVVLVRSPTIRDFSQCWYIQEFKESLPVWPDIKHSTFIFYNHKQQILPCESRG